MRKLTLTFPALLTLLATAGAAQATPAVTADRSCYSDNGATPLNIAGTGFTPGGPLEITGAWIEPDGSSYVVGTFTMTADGSGAFVDSEQTPSPRQFERASFTVTVKDQTRIAQGAPPTEQSASATFTVASYAAYFKPWNTNGPARGTPGRTALLRVDGYIGTNSRVLYVHYRLGRRLIKTLRVGRLSGTCGALTKRFRQFDFRPVPPGTYSVEFDTTRAWPNDEVSWLYRRVVVRRR
jgi:hypothetical protein